MKAPPAPSSDESGRTLVLAFDGTNNQFSDTNTNVVKFCSALKWDDPEKQLVFYQPGIGTYTDPSITIKGKLYTSIAKLLDIAFAWYLNAHVLGGYRFLMENYQPGDRICMLGFSRGSYTARALTGMLHTVGLLYKDNVEQVEFAYGLYAKRDPLTANFKKTFSRDVKVEFMGVWDTVASIGLLWSRTLPFTSSDTIKVFRHAISLDEHRSKYNVVLWEPNEESLCPDPTRTESEIEGVIEMWFAGVHSDVGGSSVKDEEPHSLGHVTFRWMMQEIHRSACGILFDYHALRELGIPSDCVPTPSTKQDPAAAGWHSIIPMSTPAPDSQSPACGSSPQHPPPYKIDGSTSTGLLSFLRTLKHKVKTSTLKSDARPKETLPGQASKPCADLDAIDGLEPIHDQLVANPLWWLLQTPVLYRREILPDFSGRRRFPKYEIQRVNQRIHRSVAIRMDSKATPYVPKARLPADWKDFLAS